ncbi:MAG: sigma 54-interacting transcriptional regulator [Candidatus Cloacimonetes bacterium]|nr:sigma 54-interacting transcriptional regulator [Candidatus Cloacimonadota bacterium]
MSNKKISSKNEIRYDSILESISDGVFTVDDHWRITSFNRAAEEITGISRREALGEICSDVFRSSMCENHCALRETLQSDTPIIDKSCYIINATGDKIPISVSTAVLRDQKGNICGGAETFRDLREVHTLRKELQAQYRVGDMISRSPAMQEIFHLLPVVAESSSNLLITGATGTGKELLARAVHNMSARADQPFIAVNCAALPDNLLESELFGYKKGAFTGADHDKPGRFALAQNGTLLLDEIGEISLNMQVKLLRVLQDHLYEPLGGTHSETATARIIAATNQNLPDLVLEGKFREDLYYRINVIKLDLPPLNERKEDIPLLVEHFINKYNHLQNKKIKSASPLVLAVLMTQKWQGNIRELENVIERAFVLCRSEVIDIQHLPPEFQASQLEYNHLNPINKLKQQTERQLIIQALEVNNYNRNATARQLGLHKSTLYRKLKKYSISLPASQYKPPR